MSRFCQGPEYVQFSKPTHAWEPEPSEVELSEVFLLFEKHISLVTESL